MKHTDSDSRTVVVALANQKGGVGKTTTSVNLAGELSQRGHRVLLIDCDPQGNATTSLGIDKHRVTISTYEMLMGVNVPGDVIYQTGRLGYDIIPASENLAGAMIELTDIERREWRLAEALEQIEGYHWILLDCPPSLGLLTLNALCAAHYVLIPLQCEYLALEGLVQLKGTIDRVRDHLNPALSIAGVVMTMYDGRTNLSQQVVEEVRQYFPQRIFDTLIPRSVRVSEAPSYGQLLNEYDPQNRAAQAYGLLADEFLQRF
ncbi:MAG: ParA family protein [Chloroflexi bacterium AL-W]|nr:ParA family protein [Chloroflexi bacterium AL-N1]NOK68139.1 ParA family protein [Chloroflexi bacterium AL-N10]NOK73479.1 ParA family protein [Chloroflexi bacterium AL-N5]NOK83393.1 ParA family protein [Chloroflexi bacterium AL-W]NOK87810.1 ParA family protein [Chloroflexi bacterium AL-N15]